MHVPVRGSLCVCVCVCVFLSFHFPRSISLVARYPPPLPILLVLAPRGASAQVLNVWLSAYLLRASMCTATVVAGMGSGWESNIARLIDEANATLSSSAYFRGTLPPHVDRRTSTSTRQPSPLRSAAPATFRGDRSASYRRDSEGWDASLLIRQPRSDGGRGGGGFPVPPPPPAPAFYSRPVASRVDSARIESMEDRINDVQTNVSTCVYGVHCFYRIVASARRADGCGYSVLTQLSVALF